MSNYVAFRAQLTSIMEVLTKAAIAEICELVDDGYAVLQLEISRSQKENEALKRKLRIMELKAARGSWVRRRAAERHVKTLGVSLWTDVETPPLDAEVSMVQTAVCEKSMDTEEDGPETITVKKEGVDEDMVTYGDMVNHGDSFRGLKSNEKRPMEAGSEKASFVDTNTETIIVNATDKQRETRHRRPREDNTDTVLKEELEHEPINIQHTAGGLNNLENGYSIYEEPGQLDTFFTQGDSDTATEAPACCYSPNSCSDGVQTQSELQLCPPVGRGAGDRLLPVGGPEVEPDIILVDSEPLKGDSQLHSAWIKESVSDMVHVQQRIHKEYEQRDEPHPENSIQMPARVSRMESNSKINRGFISAPSVKSKHRFSVREKRFICGYCGKSFTCPKYLHAHQRVHTGEKPYSCMHCGKRFAQSTYLKKHQTVHTGEKPFSCAQCGKRFADSSNLIRHRSVHTGERRFICIHCGERFAGKHNLRIHQQRSHPSV